MTIPSYIGANTTETAKTRARLNEQVWQGFEPVRRAPNTGHRFIRYSRAILPSLIGLAFLVVIAGLAAGWLAERVG